VSVVPIVDRRTMEAAGEADQDTGVHLDAPNEVDQSSTAESSIPSDQPTSHIEALLVRDRTLTLLFHHSTLDCQPFTRSTLAHVSCHTTFPISSNREDDNALCTMRVCGCGVGVG
jgi:hypothetical protein